MACDFLLRKNNNQIHICRLDNKPCNYNLVRDCELNQVNGEHLKKVIE